MSEIKWIKITTDIFDDEKIKLIDSMPERDTILVIWLKILTLAGKCNKNGKLVFADNIGYDEEMLSTLFNRPINSIRLAMATFKKFKMIDYLTEPDSKNAVYFVTNWHKHQSVVENREYWKIKQAEHREKQKQLENKGIYDDEQKKFQENVNDKSMTGQKMSMTDVNDISKTCQKNVNDCQAEEEEEEEEERNKKKEIRRKNNINKKITFRSGGNRPAVSDKNVILFNKETNLLECDTELKNYLQNAYPDIDIYQKLKEMSVWLMAHEEIEKGDGNFMRFVVKWLNNENNAKKTKKAKTYAISFNPETASFVGTDDDYVGILKSKFLGIDVDAEIKKMESWLLNNPSRRPAKDYPRFINRWLTQAQDKASMRHSSQFKSSQQTFAERKLQNSLNAVEQVKKKYLTGGNNR